MKTPIKFVIAKTLKNCGILADLDGYHYLKEAIRIVIQDESKTLRMMHIYAEVAKKYNTTSCRVERGIRHAVETGVMRCDLDTLYVIFGYTIDAKRGKPTNSTFIYTVAEYCEMLSEVEDEH